VVETPSKVMVRGSTCGLGSHSPSLASQTVFLLLIATSKTDLQILACGGWCLFWFYSLWHRSRQIQNAYEIG